MSTGWFGIGGGSAANRAKAARAEAKTTSNVPAVTPPKYSGPLIDPNTGASQLDAYIAQQNAGGGGGTGGGGGGGGGGGSYYNGLNYVPYDGFKATLHKGERVLTEAENRDYTQGNTTDNKEINQQFVFNGNVDSPYQVARAAKKAIENAI